MHWINNTTLRGYHTQEFRSTSQPLEEPIKCVAKNAWLGMGFYFWVEEEFAHYWGEDFKSAGTGSYDIYWAKIDVSKCINAVFSEDGYNLFVESIQEAIKRFETLNHKPSLEQVNRYLADKVWPNLGINGIIYDDKPIKSFRSDRVYSKIPDLYYKKRIQIVVFDLKCVHNFELYLENQKRYA